MCSTRPAYAVFGAEPLQLLLVCVPQERDWEVSSADDDAADPQELLWASLLAQQPQQQLQWLPTQPASVSAPVSASGRPASAAAAATQAAQGTGPVLPQLPGAAQSGLQCAQQPVMSGAQQVGQGRLSAGPDNAQAAVMALAAAAAGPRAKLSAAQEHLAPGMMLAQSPLRKLLELCTWKVAVAWSASHALETESLQWHQMAHTPDHPPPAAKKTFTAALHWYAVLCSHR
jgi:hypothetical protein